MYKILVLKDKLLNNDVFEKGLVIVKNSLKSINFPVEITTKEINGFFTGVHFDNSAATNNGASKGFMVDPDKIIPYVDKNVDVTCLMYNWDNVIPRPTNPVQNPRKLGKSTIVQIPENFYALYPEVMAQYFIHECLNHSLYFLLNKASEDKTHYQYKDPIYSQKPIMEWQLHLIQELMPFMTKDVLITLKKGNTSEDVKQLQRDLKALGYFKYPLITGYFGTVTESAIKAFQKATGLYVDGIAGKQTLLKIEELKKKPKIDWGLLPEVQTKADLLIEMANNIGMKIRITEGYRTPERQAELYAQGRTKPGKIVTNAKPGESYHQSRKAFDVCFIGSDPYPKDDRVWKTLADLALSIGLKSGYYFTTIKDSVHFEIQ